MAKENELPDSYEYILDKFGEEKLLLAKKVGVFSPCKGNRYKEKPFISTQRHRFPTTPKLTCNSPFQIPLATVSLQQNIPFSKLCSLALAQR